MLISWSYLGPFFDGEGTAGLYIYKSYKNPRNIKITPSIQLTCYDEIHVNNIINFLKSECIYASCVHLKNGQVRGLYIGAWGDILKFIDRISSYTIIKFEELTLLKKACKMYNGLNHKRGIWQNRKNVNIFIPISEKLHSLKSGKGQYQRKSSHSFSRNPKMFK